MLPSGPNSLTPSILNLWEEPNVTKIVLRAPSLFTYFSADYKTGLKTGLNFNVKREVTETKL
jgi:hypothetical protein